MFALREAALEGFLVMVGSFHSFSCSFSKYILHARYVLGAVHHPQHLDLCSNSHAQHPSVNE